MPRVRDSVTEQVVRRVASALNDDALELPPLYDCIDPDGLERLVDSMADGEVSFTYVGHQVTVESDGTIDVDEPRSRGTSTEVAESD